MVNGKLTLTRSGCHKLKATVTGKTLAEYAADWSVPQVVGDEYADEFWEYVLDSNGNRRQDGGVYESGYMWPSQLQLLVTNFRTKNRS